MGQQQLLLMILVTVIVDIATAVAISTFSGASESAMLDAVRQDMASIATAAQGYYMKPTGLGGGGNTFNGITFERISFIIEELSNDNKTAINTNGTYSIVSAVDGEMEISGAVLNGKIVLRAIVRPGSYHLVTDDADKEQ